MLKNKIANSNLLSLRNKESLKGYIFLIPLIIGLVTFFIIPVVKSFLFSVSDVTSGKDGYSILLTGFGAYKNALTVHTSYRQTVTSAIIDVALSTPLVILFSFFMASVLNQEFVGKTFFRVVLFLPVILIVMNSYNNTLESSMMTSDYNSAVGATTTSFTKQFSDWMISAGISEDIVSTLTGLVDKIYEVIDLSAIQILIMLVGMQSISPSLYEAAMVEGATAWEKFWKITFPMISPLVFTCIIYTVIDSFTANDNQVMELMSTTAFTDLKFSLASAMGWLYFLLIGIFLVIIERLFRRLIFSYDQ
ncbi:MAG: sugar ABC transporter permease [Clostridia bacterium]|nr:sugar ABC transporter permease [Clostridia bacterium]MBQ2315835.1 sugar ABC transporter permease [Clostridia bacterium]MEE1073936.1 sugar ABC transporter permease [Acutalibacteraceae bacterium]